MKMQIANIITSCRMLFSICLLFCPVFSACFCGIYLLCGFTDMVDGTIARKTNSVSEFGEKLDTVSDFILFAAALIKLLPAIAITLTAVSMVLVLIAIFYAAKVDYETGVYECRKCGHTFKPTFKSYILGVHTLTTRHLKCPKCEEKSWCRRMDQ